MYIISVLNSFNFKITVILPSSWLIWYKTVRHLLKQDYSNNSILWVIYRDIRIFKDTGANIQIDIAEAKWITILTFHFYHTFVTSQ